VTVVYHAEGARAYVDNASFWARLREMVKVVIVLEGTEMVQATPSSSSASPAWKRSSLTLLAMLL
jgi:hypothetical protein